MTDNIKINELDIDTEYRKDDEDFNEIYQKFCILVIDNDNQTAEKIKKQILENQNKAAENQKLKEDAELDQDIDWGDDGQRYCPTHKQSYHLYCKLCKSEIKTLKSFKTKLENTLEEAINRNEKLESERDNLKEKIEKTIKECNDTIQAYEHLNESHQQKYEKTKDDSYLSTINRNNDLINENKKIKEILGDKNTVYDEEVKCPDCGLTPEKCYVHWDEVKDHCKNCNLYFIYNKKDPLNTIKHVTAEYYDSQEGLS